MTTEMTTRDQARTVLGAQALVDEAGAHVKAERQNLLAEMAPGDRIAVRATSGEEVGKVWVSDPKARTVVTDSEAFVRWVQENHPEEVVMIPTIRSSYRDALIKADGIDPTTGEEVPGMAQTVGTPTLTVKPTEYGRSLAAKIVGSALGIEGGAA